MNLKNKVAVVTGGARGIGRATSLKLSSEGAKVVIVDLDKEAGQETVNLIKENGGDALLYEANVANFDEVERMIDYTAETYGRLDILFNNAGIGTLKPLLEHDIYEDFDKVIKVNQYGFYYTLLAAARKMVELGIKGSIINNASVYGYMAAKGLIGYGTSKGAIINMTKTAALELAPYGIRVTGIAPGRIETPMLDEYKELGLWDVVKNDQMMKQVIQPEQVANVVAFLASEESSAINATIVMVDDGFTSFKKHYENL
jgi:NAD(P)-dependent dehydrogenase (short-subunit alcohol dehydrogenase family)